MSAHNSVMLVATAVKDTVSAIGDGSVVQGAVQAVAQNTAAAAADVVGKGGFSVIPTIGELVEFQLTGLLVVFTVLGGLTLMCMLMAWILKTVAPNQYYGKPKAAPSAPPAAAVKPAPVGHPSAPAVASLHPGLSDEKLVALLAVAATEVMGKPVSVVMFRPMNSLDWTWSVQGRVGLHTSHKL